MGPLRPSEEDGNRVKPYLLLDVDGAVSPLAAPDGTYPDGVKWMKVANLSGAVLVDARLPGWLNELAGLFELAWATTWGDDANRILSTPLGLAPLPMVDVRGSKVDAVLEFCGDRRAAWVDDRISAADKRKATMSGRDILFVCTTKHRGITAHDVERLKEWASTPGGEIA